MNSAAQEGNALDRSVSLTLFLLGIAILVSRSFRWSFFVRKNLALTAYLLFALASALWSDFPALVIKKWVRDLGTFVMVLVVISDAYPVEAVSTLFRRVGYLVLPLSVVLIKYFPDLAWMFDGWTGEATYTGAATSKNMLGIVCLVCGIYFFWDTVVRWPQRKNRVQKRVLLVNAVLSYLTWWLLVTCNSVTSMTCLIIAYLVILAAHSKAIQRRPRILSVAIPASFLTYAVLFFGLGLSGSFAAAVGRTSLSGRPEIWQLVLSQGTDPLLGAGYESFWLGSRLQSIWSTGWAINSAHNGYLEVYLNLGFIGVSLVLLFMVAVYRNVCRELRSAASIASFSLAIWTAFAFHNTSEADFRTGLMWVVFLLAALAVSALGYEAARREPVLHRALARPQFRSRIASRPAYARRNS